MYYVRVYCHSFGEFIINDASIVFLFLFFFKIFLLIFVETLVCVWEYAFCMEFICFEVDGMSCAVLYQACEWRKNSLSSYFIFAFLEKHEWVNVLFLLVQHKRLRFCADNNILLQGFCCAKSNGRLQNPIHATISTNDRPTSQPTTTTFKIHVRKKNLWHWKK